MSNSAGCFLMVLQRLMDEGTKVKVHTEGKADVMVGTITYVGEDYAAVIPHYNHAKRVFVQACAITRIEVP